MNTNHRSTVRGMLMISLMLILTFASTRLHADSGPCGTATTTLPFTDVSGSNIFFCSIASAYFTGLTSGTTPTTYNPFDPVPREQMAAFITRTMDQSLKRGSSRAALDQYWTPTSPDGLELTTVGAGPQSVKSDGADLWVANFGGDSVSRVRASDGKLLETWTGASNANRLVVAKGQVFITGFMNPGKLYQIDPDVGGVTGVTTLSSTLGAFPVGISFDGARIWTANSQGTVSIVTLNPVSVDTVTDGLDNPQGILYDGANMWVTDQGTDPGKLIKLNANGSVSQTVTVGTNPTFPVFDGTNIWVPNSGSNTVTVVRASSGAVLATLSGNGLNTPDMAAFDGERIMLTNVAGDSVSLWKAADLTPLGFVSTGATTAPKGVCSDGLNFWITLLTTGKLARF